MVEIAKKCVETIAKTKAPSNEVFTTNSSNSSAISIDGKEERMQEKSSVSNSFFIYEES
jgi:hypothetical protein